MNFEETKSVLENIDEQDGFTPSDLLDLPEEIVPILRQMMTRKGKSLTDLSHHFHMQENQTHQILDIMQHKGLVQQNMRQNQIVYTAKLK
ncbi:MAG: FeoC-like transcriptional regulator [Chloroflexota bacterium]